MTSDLISHACAVKSECSLRTQMSRRLPWWAVLYTATCQRVGEWHMLTSQGEDKGSSALAPSRTLRYGSPLWLFLICILLLLYKGNHKKSAFQSSVCCSIILLNLRGQWETLNLQPVGQKWGRAGDLEICGWCLKWVQPGGGLGPWPVTFHLTLLKRTRS